MNENLYVSNHGLRLITQFEGAPRLKARLCEGGRYELSYGVTFHLDGRPVEAEETCTEDYAMALFRNALGQFEEVVKRHVTIDLTQYQFDALVAFSYNVGETNFASSTVLRETNARRFEDAAAAFGMWVFATRDGWKQAYRGLLRRRYAEATLYMGYDWVQATEDGENGAISLQRIPPPGDPPKGSDKVTYKTPFLEVLRVAQHYPLAPDTQEPVEAKPAPAPLQDSAKPLPQPAVPSAADTKGPEPTQQATQPVNASAPAPNSNSASTAESRPAPASVAPPPSPAGVGASTLPKITPKTLPPVATDLAPLPIPKPASKFSVPITDSPYRINPDFGFKPMEETERHQASIAQNGGMVMMRLARYGFFGTGPATVATFIEKDPIFAGAFLALLGVIVVYSIGYCRKSFGDWKRYHAERVACQAMV